jgi:hypothetical protein
MFRILGSVAALALLSAGSYWGWQTSVSADVGAAAMAKVVCSCVFVDGRSLESCRKDDPPGFEQISVEIDAARLSATGSVLGGLIKRRASYSEEYGCTLEP